MTKGEPMWCLDRWYASRESAEGMREFYLAEGGATEAHIVTNSTDSEHPSYGVVYAAPVPYAEWHAGNDPQPTRSWEQR